MKEIRYFDPCDRYVFDFDICSPSKLWAQIDTGQDAHYSGSWCNPFLFEVISYTEGDIVKRKFSTRQGFIDEINDIKNWNNKNGYSCAIDPGLSTMIKKQFEKLGLSHLLH